MAFFICVVLAVIYYCKDTKAVYPLLYIITLRQSFALMDFEQRRFRMPSNFEIMQFEIAQVVSVFVLQFCINFMFLNKWVIAISNVSNFLLMTFGTLILNSTEKEPFSF